MSTAADLRRALREYDVRDIIAVLANNLASAGNGGGQPTGIQYVDVQLDNDTILNLMAEEVEVIDAPGAGKAILLHAVNAVLDQSNGTYESGELFGELDFGFAEYWIDTNASWFAGLPGPVTSAYLDLASGALYSSHLPASAPNSPMDLSPIANLPLCFGNIGGQELEGGGAGNTLSARIWYSIIDLVPFTP